MGHKKYMLVGDVKYPMNIPLRTLWNQLFSIDFYALSDETCCQKQITGNIVKIAIFNMAAMKNVEKWKMGISVNFDHHKFYRINT